MPYLHNILGGAWFVEENLAANYFPLIASFLTEPETMFGKPRSTSSEQESTEDNVLLFVSLKNGAYQISGYGGWSPPEDAPKNSVVIMNTNGAITKYDQECGPSGMLTKANLLNRCCNESNIKAVALNIDSDGGEGMGCRIMQEAIDSRNEPVVALCNDFVASTAYGIASCYDKIVANSNVCRIGSVGIYMTIVDTSEYHVEMGIELIDIYASKSTSKNQEFHKVLQGDTEPLKKVYDTYNENFISSIVNARVGVINEDQGRQATGKMFFAPEATDIGMIDEIDTFENVFDYFNTQRFMKWLKDDSYNVMKQTTDNWDKLLDKVLGNNSDMRVEDVTVDQPPDLIESTGNISDLQEQLSVAQEKLKEKDTPIKQLQPDVAKLKGTPASKKPEAKVK